jgi:ATP-dependent DNA helicase RecQ
VRAWIDQLIGCGHLRVSGDRYPTLSLSPTGLSVMKGEQPITLWAVPKPARAARRRAPDLSAEEGLDVDETLFESLRTLRRDLARERGIPPYLIFNDKTLALMAATQPRTPEELLRVKGVGEKKAADLGPAFLARIAAHRSK